MGILLNALAFASENEMTGLQLGPVGLHVPSIVNVFDDGPPNQNSGFYAADGKILRNERLADSSADWLKLMQPRMRGFGTHQLTKILEWSAARVKALDPRSERLQIGDISNEDGGKCGGHASHQNGLDADVVYLRVNRKEQNPNSTKGFEESFVVGNRVTANFDIKRNFSILKEIVSTNRVGRIFVDTAIKLALCSYVKQNGWMNDAAALETLRRVRPWPLHDDHFHLRIKCSARSPDCVEQADPAPGAACDVNSQGFMATEDERI